MKNTIFPLTDSVPKYKQVYEHFKCLIEQGDVLVDEKLPSIRDLASSLQVSRNTTLMAYEQLVAEGYIRGEGRKGYFVNECEPHLFQSAITTIEDSKTQHTPPIVIDFKAHAVDQTHFPLKSWRSISNYVLTLPETYLYGEALGERCLREQIANYLRESRGLSTNADAIIIGSSTQQMLINLGYILKESFRSVIIEDPGYIGAKKAFEFHHFDLEILPVYETGADLAVLPELQSKLICVTPSHHSPYGISMSIQERQQLIQWANTVGGYIIEDDYDSEFGYAAQPFPALASIDASKVVYLGNFSKSFLPGIRISYMVLPQKLLTLYKKQFFHFESNTSLHSQLTMAKFMQDGEWNRHIKRMRIVYKRKMQCLVSLIETHLTTHVSILSEQSGLFLLMKVHLPHSEERLIEKAAATGVKVYPTSNCFITYKSHVPIIKLGFSNLSYNELETGITLLKNAWL